MSHKSIRLLIENTAKSLQDNIQYSYGKETDFNQDRKNHSLMVNLAPLNASPAYVTEGTMNYSKSWQVQMVIYKFDEEASIDYQNILDETDEIVDKFLNKLNYFMLRSDGILIQGIQQTAVIKATADILTGHLLTFTLQAEDSFDYCPNC